MPPLPETYRLGDINFTTTPPSTKLLCLASGRIWRAQLLTATSQTLEIQLNLPHASKLKHKNVLRYYGSLVPTPSDINKFAISYLKHSANDDANDFANDVANDVANDEYADNNNTNEQ